MIKYFTTIIFVILGTIFLGFPGAIFGLLLGNLIFKFSDNSEHFSYSNERKMKITVLEAIIRIAAVVMQADKQLMRSELYLFRDFMLKNFGNEAASHAITYLQNIRDLHIDEQDACDELNNALNYTEKMQILRFLFQLAYVDGIINRQELQKITYIATLLYIRKSDFVYMKSSFEYAQKQYNNHSNSKHSYYNSSYNTNNDLDNAYAILGVKSSDDNETIKKAYRSLAMANHPDKVQHLGETARKEAEKRFSEIAQAYNKIKKVRNL